MKRRALIVCSVLAASAAVRAQDPGWHYLVEPYVMFPNMKGETGIRQLPPAQVDENPGDIFGNLQMGAMLFAEARNDAWAFSSDVLYMNLQSDIAARTLLTGGSVEVSQLGWELAAMRRLTPWLELGIGATYNKIDADVKLDVQSPFAAQGTLEFGMSKEWIDPSIVARASVPIGDQWFFQARGNVGGFGAGSDLMWQLQLDFGWRMSEKWLFTFGYRIIDIDYDHGSGADRFRYDMQTFGPVLKAGYSF